MSKLFRFIFSVYGSFMFMFWIVVAFLSYVLFFMWFGKKLERTYIRFLYRFIGKCINISLLLRVDTTYHAKYDKNQSYVVVSNHQTMIDIPANVAAFPKEMDIKFLGKSEASKIPFFGFLIKRFCVLVDRKDPISRKSSYKRMKQEMNNGYSIFLYPEGTRNRTDELLKDFYDGAFRLAIEQQKPLVVNTLMGIKEINPITSYFTLRPGIVKAHFEAPICTEGLTLEDIPKLKEQVKSLMVKRLQAYYGAN